MNESNPAPTEPTSSTPPPSVVEPAGYADAPAATPPAAPAAPQPAEPTTPAAPAAQPAPPSSPAPAAHTIIAPPAPPNPAFQTPAAPKHKFSLAPFALAAVMLLVGLLAGFGLGHYAIKPAAKVAPNSPATQATASLELPKNATAIAECAVGRGKQYALPKDIPTGPVYNVWNNKVIGIEFMVGRDELLSQNKTLVNLPLHGVAYDHVNIGLLSQGHAGYPEPHYHVDVFTVSNTEASKITCK